MVDISYFHVGWKR